MVEALACGVPAIVSPHVNLAAEIAEAGAGWVTPLERPFFAASLRDVMRDEPERQRRGTAGRELGCRRFTWPAVADQLITVYEAAASGLPSITTREAGDVIRQVLTAPLCAGGQAQHQWQEPDSRDAAKRTSPPSAMT